MWNTLQKVQNQFFFHFQSVKNYSFEAYKSQARKSFLINAYLLSMILLINSYLRKIKILMALQKIKGTFSLNITSALKSCLMLIFCLQIHHLNQIVLLFIYLYFQRLLFLHIYKIVIKMQEDELNDLPKNKRVHALTLSQIQEAMKGQNQKPVAQSLKLKRCCLREGCEDINNYKRLNKIHEGQYGVVYRAIELPTNNIYAVKKLKMKEGSDFPITSLRQISILRGLDHPNIIKITRVAGSLKQDKVYIVMQYLDHEVKELLKSVKFKETEIRRLTKDLLEGMAYLHDRKIVHRDLKTSNLLYSNAGILKICDFGLARKAAQALMTQQVITMWYRPPQLLLGEYHYSTQLDIWSVGCIMAELFLRQPLFQGKTQIQQLDLIFKGVGSPTEQSWPEFKLFKNYIYVQGKRYPVGKLPDLFEKGEFGLSSEGLDLLKNLLVVNPKKRMTAKKALAHIWFKGQIATRDNMPKLTPLNESDRVTKKKIKLQQANK